MTNTDPRLPLETFRLYGRDLYELAKNETNTLLRSNMANEEQAVMFPELDSSPEHKAILRLAKRLAKIRADRKEALEGSKEQEDKTQADLVEKLHEANLKAFKHDSIAVTLQDRGERVKIKMDLDEEEEQEAEDK